MPRKTNVSGAAAIAVLMAILARGERTAGVGGQRLQVSSRRRVGGLSAPRWLFGRKVLIY